MTAIYEPCLCGRTHTLAFGQVHNPQPGQVCCPNCRKWFDTTWDEREYLRTGGAVRCPECKARYCQSGI